jgi:hypothetical protein
MSDKLPKRELIKENLRQSHDEIMEIDERFTKTFALNELLHESP